MREFPKMLYLGTVQTYQHKVAQNEDHEAKLQELGFVDFTDLENEAENMSAGLSSISNEDFKNAYVSVEQFDAVSEELVQKELQLNVAQTQRDQFKTENDDLKAQLNKERETNQQLQKIIDAFQPEATKAPVNTVDYNSMTTDQLRTILDEKKVKYLARDKKEALLALLTQPIKTEE